MTEGPVGSGGGGMKAGVGDGREGDFLTERHGLGGAGMSEGVCRGWETGGRGMQGGGAWVGG